MALLHLADTQSAIGRGIAFAAIGLVEEVFARFAMVKKAVRR